jgi:hypothetical protein
LVNLMPRICQAFIVNQYLSPTGACSNVPPKIIRTPDPYLYTQRLEFSEGRIPSWDNPDLITHNEQNYEPLERITAKVHNSSSDVSSNGTAVRFEWSQFGIGFERNQLGTYSVDLSRRGFPGDMKELQVALPAEVIALKDLCVFVSVFHPHDNNHGNNEGEQCVKGRRVSEVGRSPIFDIPIRNSTSQILAITMNVNPNRWGINITPISFSLSPAQMQNVRVSFNIPQNVPIGTKQKFDVFATSPTGLFGGIILGVNVDG